MIYFLGQYSRCYLADPKRPGHDTHCYRRVPEGSPETQPLFEILPGRGARAAVSGSIDGESYHIPAGSRSVALIAMVETLINLQKSAKDQPVSSTVRVIK